MVSWRQADLTPVAWVAGGELPYDDWVRQGSRLGVASRGSGWWIGDWVRYGATRYGRRYAVAAAVTRYDEQTLMNMVYVATRFEISRRRESLSWSHHAELAAIDREEQERWLDRAVAEKLSVREMRRALLTARHPSESSEQIRPTVDFRGDPVASLDDAHRGRSLIIDTSTTTDRDIAAVVTCPECGHQFRR